MSENIVKSEGEMSEEDFVAQQEEENKYLNEIDSDIKKIKATADEALEEIEQKKPKKGRKKKEVDDGLEDDIEVSGDLVQDLYNEFSSFLVKTAEISPDTIERKVIPTGIRVLDAYLGGGFPCGTFCMIVGTPGCGKSMLAGQILGAAQIAYDGALTAFLDSEESTTKIRLANLGVRNPFIEPYTDITIEKFFKFIEGLCVFKTKKDIDTPSVVVWDSIANTLSKREREAEDVNQVIGVRARILSILLPKYISKMSTNNILVVSVNQLRDQLQMGPFSQPKLLKFLSTGKTIPGGNSLIHNSFTLLEMKITKTFDEEKSPYGFPCIISHVNTVKNKLFVPNIGCDLIGDFNHGFSDFWTSYSFLANVNKLTTGAWNYLVSMPDVKFRTKDAHEKYSTDETFHVEFDKQLEEAIKIHIVDKYNPETMVDK